MMHDVGIHATFYLDLCFCAIPVIQFLHACSLNENASKFCVREIETPTTSHSFWIYIKVRTKFMCLVVAIFFGSTIKCDRANKSHN
jgi:hypothetical protein